VSRHTVRPGTQGPTLQGKSLLLGGSDSGTAMAAFLRAFSGAAERPTLAGVMRKACRLKIAARGQNAKTLAECQVTIALE
jgi:hypothetical protein